MRPRSRRRLRLPKLIIGPILHARGTQGDRWRVAACFVFAGEGEPPDLRVDGVGLPVPPRFLHDWGDLGDGRGHLSMWRYDFAVPRGPQDGRAGYGLDGDERRWHFDVPGTATGPRIAYVACGGCEDEAEIAEAGLSRNERWAHLLGRHRAAPFHILLMGGDQVYADGLWENVEGLRALADRSMNRRSRSEALPGLETQLDAWYLGVYVHGWSQAEPAAMLSSVPVLCMWDDHDIIDGWGSHPPEILDSPVYRTIFRAARRAFHLFQLGLAEDEEVETALGGRGGFSQGLILNDVGILAPDLRSERRPDRVLSDESRAAFDGWLDRFAECRHLLLMSSVPMVFPGLGFLETLFGLIPGRQRFEDDLRDQWRSPAHREEWMGLIAKLAAFARGRRCRVSILSGEVHLGAVGVIRGLDLEIWQMVSSGIVHPPPPDLFVKGMEKLGGRRETLPDGLTVESVPFAETGRRMLPTRNWLSLTAGTDGVLTVEWHAEKGPTPLRLAIPPM